MDAAVAVTGTFIARLHAVLRTAAPRLNPLTQALILAVSVTAAVAPSASARRGTTVKPTQELVSVLSSHRVFSSFNARGSWVGTVQATRPITGERTVLPVVARATSPGGARWLRVMLPGRPNGMQGWITKRGTVLTTTSWHLVVRTASRRVLAYRRGRLVRSFMAIVGKPSTPTPRGQFFVEETVLMPAGSAGAPFALALSARSDVLQEFEGGPGQIAIHGIENLGGTLGTAVSHGCIRLGTPAITWLSNRIGPGTPVTITA